MKKVIRKRDIESKLTEIIENLKIISENLPKSFEEFAASGLIKDGIYKRVEFAIEEVLDICNIINADLRLGMPEEDEDILINLEKNKILNKEIIENIRNIKGFRNILVHKYGSIDDIEAYESIREGLDDFEKIIRSIEKFIDKY